MGTIIILLLLIYLQIILFVLSIVFKIAKKTRLTLPVLYILAAVVSTFFTDWTSEHELLVFIGLGVLVGAVLVSWVISFIKVLRRKRQERFIEEDIAWQIQRARELGVPMQNISFDESGNLLDPRTGKPVVFGNGVEFRDF